MFGKDKQLIITDDNLNLSNQQFLVNSDMNMFNMNSNQGIIDQSNDNRSKVSPSSSEKSKAQQLTPEQQKQLEEQKQLELEQMNYFENNQAAVQKYLKMKCLYTVSSPSGSSSSSFSSLINNRQSVPFLLRP
jgi:hypothetical protein